MANLLVTGAAGFIGANFVHYWTQQYPQDKVWVLDALTYAGNLASIQALIDNDSIHFIHGNITDQALIENLLRTNDILTIVNFAAESHVDRSISGPDAFVETNIIGTHALLKAARQVWLQELKGAEHRFHHVSTDEVFGSLNPHDPPFAETNQYQPNSPYSATKAASDHLVRAYHHTYGMQVTTSNCSNNYGPFHFPEKLIPLCITNLLDGKKLPIYGDGQNIRDWLYVEDHCRGIDLVLKKGQVGETYNIGGINEWDNLTLVRLLCQKMDQAFAQDPRWSGLFPQCPAAQQKHCDSLIEFVTDRAGHDRRYAICTDKICAELGYRPLQDFETNLTHTIHWYLANETWWRPLLNRR